jgi:hypothetical protein
VHACQQYYHVDALLLAGGALARSACAVPDSLLHASNDCTQQLQHAAGTGNHGNQSNGPFAAAATQQQTIDVLQISGNGPAGPGNGPQLMPSADFALFAQLHLHNPAPASRQLQQQHSATPQHPIIESFPSFNTQHSAGLQHEVLQQAADEAAAACEAAADADAQGSPADLTGLDGTTAAAAAAAGVTGVSVQRPVSSEVSPASSSDAALLLSSSGSPLQQLQQQAHQQHSQQQQSARKVSLLSQQIACARSRSSSAAADVSYGAAGSERGVGSTHHHASEFWRYMQVRRSSRMFQGVGTWNECWSVQLPSALLEHAHPCTADSMSFAAQLVGVSHQRACVV